MNFFSNMERGLEEEGQELGDEGKALQDGLRMHRRAKRLDRARSNPRLQREAGALPRDLLRGARDSFQKSASCAALPPVPQRPPRPGRQEWEMHDEAWDSFEAQPPEPLFVESVPWPPLIEDTLEFCQELQGQGDIKKGYRVACRRWHPDKFLQRYGTLVPPQELAYMTFRVNEVFQAITSQWQLAQPRR